MFSHKGAELTDIVDTEAIQVELDVTLSSADFALLDRLRRSVESSVRQFVRWGIVSEEQTVYLPAQGPVGRVLLLPSPYVSEVKSVWEDWQGHNGQREDSFGSSCLLTAGVDYFLSEDRTDWTGEGVLIRINKDWCPYERSIKVVFTAGLTEGQLNGEFFYVKDAIIGESIERYKYQKTRQGADGSEGVVVSERNKDWAQTIQPNVSRSTQATLMRMPANGLLPETRDRLQPLVSYYSFF